MSVDFITSIFWSVLDGTVDDHAKLILLLCCVRLPRSRPRNSLFESCMSVRTSLIDKRKVSFWLTF